jgi:DNA-binding transcriptional regulator YiaG
MALTGMDLRLRRTAARVKITDLAARMGRSRATIHRYEGLAVVPNEAALEYLDALATLQDVATRKAA